MMAGLAQSPGFRLAWDVKSERHRQDLLTYIANKESMFAPRSPRGMLGPENSSNGVEAANQMIVSARQKDGSLMFWRERGSGSLATCEATDRNGGTELWFGERRVTLDMFEPAVAA